MGTVESERNFTTIFDRLTDRFLPQEYQDRAEERFRGVVVVALSFLLSIFGPIYAAILYTLTLSVAQMLATVAATAGVVAAPFLMKKGISFLFIGNWLTFCGYALFVFVASQNMGPAVLIWQIVFIILAALIAGRRSAVVWLLIGAVTTAYFYINLLPDVAEEGVLFTRAQMIWEMCLVIGMFVAVIVLTLAYESIKDWALEQARRKEAHTRAVLNAAPDGMITLSSEGRVDGFNPAAVKLFRYEQAAIAKAPFTTLIPSIDGRPPSGDGDGELLDGTLFGSEQSGEDSEGLELWLDDTHEVEAVTREGRRFPSELYITRIDGEERFVAVVRDVTSQKAAQEALRQARDKAVEANEAKSRFLANVSHELRTPLNAIIGYSELVGEDLAEMGEEALRADVAKVGKAGKHLLSLINEVLDLSKVEAGEMQIYTEDVEVATLVEEVTDTLAPIIEEQENTLRIDTVGAPSLMRVDQMKLRQILINLLSNASKFTPGGLIRVNVFGEEKEGQEWVIFEVVDRGIGIAEDKLEQLFKAFKQADDSTTRKFGGTGLGLTICRHFATLMGGDISVESEVGQGSTFRVKLPVDFDAWQDEETASQQVEEKADGGDAEPVVDGEAGSRPQQQGELPKVLVIDDDPTVHQLMDRFLVREGFAVETSAGGPDVLDKIRQSRPDIITLDVLMPEVDGWSLLERLKASEDLRDIPVVMLTIINDRNLGFSLGATDYLTKPVDPRRLVGALSSHLNGEDSGPILIVEDDDDTREIIKRMVEQSGWKTAVAEDGQRALELLDDDLEPAAILLDLMMPRLDGFGLLEALRNRPRFDDTAIIVVTAADMTHQQRHMLQGSVDQVLQKGDEAKDRLVAELRGLLHRKRIALSKPAAVAAPAEGDG